MVQGKGLRARGAGHIPRVHGAILVQSSTDTLQMTALVATVDGEEVEQAAFGEGWAGVAAKPESGNKKDGPAHDEVRLAMLCRDGHRVRQQTCETTQDDE